MKENVRSTFLVAFFVVVVVTLLSRHKFKIPEEHLRFDKEIAIW